MNLAGVPAALVLAGAAALACNDVHARPHAPPPPWKDPAGPPTEPEVWLRRLVGRFQFDGLVRAVSQGDCAPLPPANPEQPPPAFQPACEGITGMADCVAVGSSAGVHCVLNARWRDLYFTSFEDGTVTTPPGGVSYLNPAMALFGLDAAGGAISYLLVDNKGLAEGGPGLVRGHRTTFRTPCVNVFVGCEREIRIEARPEANLLYMWIDIQNELTNEPITSIVLSLRRVRPGR